METGIRAYNAKSMPIVYELCRIARIREIVNEMVEWREDNSRVSPGLLIESLVISIMYGKKSLWLLDKFWGEQDKEYFFGESGIAPEQLNDDAYGRALDKLSRIKCEVLIGKIGLALLKAHSETINRIHVDTTSVSVEGEYKKEVEIGEFDVKFGHSKDLRPDLKQFKIGLAVQGNGLPVMGEIMSGNKSDRAWNPKAIKEMEEHFTKEGYFGIIYIGDSATVSSYTSLKELKNILFISRFPETFKIVGELKEEAIKENKWEEIKKEEELRYKVKGYIREIEGTQYRLVVVHSMELRAKKEKTMLKKVDKDKELLDKKIKKFESKIYVCKDEAATAIQNFMSDKSTFYFEIESKIEEKISIKYKRKGRPGANEKGDEIKEYVVKIEIKGTKEEMISKLCDLEGCFVLITSIIDEKFTDKKVLEEYKGQNSVEQAFKFIKDPVYLGPVFLNNKNRIKALGYVFVLVLFIASYFEYRIRKYLKENNEFLIQPNKQKQQRPKLKTILELLESVIIIVSNGERKFQENVSPKVLDAIRWVGFDPEIYLKHSVFGEDKLLL